MGDVFEMQLQVWATKKRAFKSAQEERGKNCSKCGEELVGAGVIMLFPHGKEWPY